MTRCFFQTRGEQITTFPLLPPLAGRGNSASIITSSYIFSLPVSLMFFFFFFPFPSSFHLLITLCTQPTQIKEQLQSRSRKLELKGFSLSFYLLLLLLSPRFSTLLFKQLMPSRGAERGDVLPEPGRSLFTFPFFFFFYFISLRQFSAECRGPGITGSNRRAPEHGKGTGARVEDS